MDAISTGPLMVTIMAVVLWGYCLWDFTRTPERDIRTFTLTGRMAVVANVAGGSARPEVGRLERS
ncbi:hypothetical protein OHA10_11395 [Kribbella sp. NBC_00662]|uniref:hypothetical protein n=1 Tax=Kribbella sp. NBC_00662 TaxID=2975969 RepID=UPI003249A94D